MNIVAKAMGRGRFRASVDGHVLCPSTTTPFFSAARVLQREGVPADTPLTMTHEGSATVSLRSTVGHAAGLTVVENDHRGPVLARYHDFPAELSVAA